MTEVKARRKRAPRSEKPGKEGDQEGRKEESHLFMVTHQGQGLHIKCSPGGVVVIIPIFQMRKLNSRMGERNGVWETQGKRTRVGSVCS